MQVNGGHSVEGMQSHPPPLSAERQDPSRPICVKQVRAFGLITTDSMTAAQKTCPRDVICNIGEHAVGQLGNETANSNHVLYQLDHFVYDAADGAQPIAAYDLEPIAVADIPKRRTLQNGGNAPDEKLVKSLSITATSMGILASLTEPNTKPK